MDVGNLSIKQLHTRASSCMVSFHISERVCKTYVSGNTLAMLSYWNNLNLSVLVLSVFFYLTQTYPVSRQVCAIHMSKEIHLQCFPIETTSLFRSVDIWCCHTRSNLVYTSAYTSARMCHTHVNGDTSPMFSYWQHFIVSVPHGYLVLSYTVVSRTSAPVLPPSSYYAHFLLHTKYLLTT